MKAVIRAAVFFAAAFVAFSRLAAGPGGGRISGGGDIANTITSSATITDMYASTLTVVNNSAGSITTNANFGKNASNYSTTLTAKAGASGNGIFKIEANGAGVASFFSGSTGGAVIRTDTASPMYIGANQTNTLVKVDWSGLGPVEAASIDGVITPTRTGMMIHNTSTPGEVCISTGTTVGAWVQLRAITTPCSN